MDELGGAVVVITGASRGIGAATARAFAAKGCHIVLAARTSEQITALASELQQEWGIKALAVTTDVRDVSQVDALMSAAKDQMGGIDILINNAGLGSSSPLADTSESEMTHLFEVNVYGPVRAMRAALPHLKRRGGGTIVNIGSIVSYFALPGDGKSAVSSTYCATKFALRAYTTAARAELLNAKVHTVLAIVGLTNTDFQKAAFRSEIGPQARAQKPNSALTALRGLAVPPERVAERLVKAVQRRENEVCVSWFDRLLVQLIVWLPGLQDFLARVYLGLGSSGAVWKYLRGRDYLTAVGVFICLKCGGRLLFRRR